MPQARITAGQGQDHKFTRTTALMSRDSVCSEENAGLNMNAVECLVSSVNSAN